MSRWRLPLCLLAGAHLFLVSTGAAGKLGLLGAGWVGRSLQWYAGMSGGDAGFSYFAPEVGSEMRIHCVLWDSEGQHWQDELTAGHNQEVRLRVGSMTGLFPADPEGEVLRHDLAASWAATMFGRHPRAEKVLVGVQVYEVPSMAEYRAGARPDWVPVYAMLFSLASPAPEPGTQEGLP